MPPPIARRLVVSLIAVGLVCVPLSACETEPFEGRVTRSRHFEYHDRDPQPLCPLLLPLLDEYIEQLSLVTDLQQDLPSVIRYYKFGSVEDLTQSATCPGHAGACAGEQSVLSPSFFDAHELAHVYASTQWGGQSNALLTEGVAVALSCAPKARYSFASEERPNWRALAHVSGAFDWSTNSILIAARDYSAAGAFVTAIAAKYGWARVGELYRRVSPGAYSVDFEREFARVMPVTLDEAWDLALAEDQVATCLKNPRCALSEQPEGEQLGVPNCTDVHKRPIALDTYSGAVVSLRGTGVTVQSCSDPNRSYWLRGSDSGDLSTTHWLNLPRDRYLFVNGEDHPPLDLALERYLRASLWQKSCTDAEPVILTDRRETFIDLPPGTIDGWIALRGDGMRYQVTLNTPLAPENSAMLCESCAPETECTPIRTAGVTTATLTNAMAIKFENAVSIDWIQLRITRID